MKRWAVVIAVLIGIAPFARADEEEDLRRLAAELEKKLEDVTKELEARTARVRAGRKKAAGYQEKISALLREAEKAEDRGQTERARELRHKARELNRELDALHARMGPKGLAKPEQILEGLRAGHKAALMAGDEEAAEHMARAIRRVEERMVARKRKRGEDREIRAAREQVRTLKVAMHALLDAGKEKLAHQVEHKAHAIELAIERRRDEKAREIQRTAPKAGAMTEILLYAERLLKERDQDDWAHRVGELAKVFRAKWEREQEDRGQKERVERTMDFVRKGMREEDTRRMLQRIERLEDRVERITKLLEELVARERR
jgi:hypothetical protein